VRKFFLAIALATIIVACAKKQEKPEGLLSQSEMVAFLIDMHIAEARITDLSVRRDSAVFLFEVMEDSLFKKHNIAHDSIYLASYEYYINNVGEMEKIYSAVVDSLSLRERLSKMEKEKEDEKE
jgi:hypothetical protein